MSRFKFHSECVLSITEIYTIGTFSQIISHACGVIVIHAHTLTHITSTHTCCGRSEQLIHQLKLDEKQHEELLEQERAKKMAELQASLLINHTHACQM